MPKLRLYLIWIALLIILVSIYSPSGISKSTESPSEIFRSTKPKSDGGRDYSAAGQSKNKTCQQHCRHLSNIGSCVDLNILILLIYHVIDLNWSKVRENYMNQRASSPPPPLFLFKNLR